MYIIFVIFVQIDNVYIRSAVGEYLAMIFPISCLWTLEGIYGG